VEPLAESWVRAVEEEGRGDALFYAGLAGAAGHYRAAQQALFPPGLLLDDEAENRRRMEAFGRLTQKLYEIGGDGRRRGLPDPVTERTPPAAESAAAVARPTDSEPGAVQSEPGAVQSETREVHGETREAIPKAPERARPEAEMSETALGKLFDGDDHWMHYHLGQQWMRAAERLAGRHTDVAERACLWSAYHYGLYNAAWSRHLPASRWDTDGIEEQQDADSLRAGLPAADPGVTAPLWMRRLAEGDWRGAVQEAPELTEGGEWEPLRQILLAAVRAG
jgi:hypothetical protein